MYSGIVIAWICFLGGILAVEEIEVRKIGEESASHSRSLIEKFFPDCVNRERDDTKALMVITEEASEIPESGDNVFLVAVKPDIPPFVKRHTDNPGGLVGEFMNALKERLNLTVRYIWLSSEDRLLEFTKLEGYRLAFDLKAGPKIMTNRSKNLHAIQRGVWIVAQGNDLQRKNILTGQFTDHIYVQLILLTIYIVVTVYVSRDLDKTRIILRMYSMFFGISAKWLPKKWLTRFLTIIWCFGSSIVVQMYFSTLTSHLTSTNDKSVIKNSEELVKSGIKIFCTNIIKEYYCRINETYATRICRNCIPMEFDENWGEKLESQFKNRTLQSYAFNSNSLTSKERYNKKPYSVIPEEIGVWPCIIRVSRNVSMEYLEQMQHFFQQYFETGFMKHWLEHHIVKNTGNDRFGYEPLKISQMNNAFIVLFVGWACSSVVFIIELLVKRYRSN